MWNKTNTIVHLERMNYSILFIIGLAFSFQVHAQINQETQDLKHRQTILINEINKDGLTEMPYASWFFSEYDAYEPNQRDINQINFLQSPQDSIEVIIFLATWCGDSREQVPHFLKLIEQLRYQPKVTMYALDEYKNCEVLDVTLYDIERVPTFIFYKKGEEIGRIVETPGVSLEVDYADILE